MRKSSTTSYQTWFQVYDIWTGREGHNARANNTMGYRVRYDKSSSDKKRQTDSSVGWVRSITVSLNEEPRVSTPDQTNHSGESSPCSTSPLKPSKMSSSSMIAQPISHCGSSASRQHRRASLCNRHFQFSPDRLFGVC